MTHLALIAPVQFLVDVLEPILVFIHDTFGVGWGMSIVLLTVLVRAAMAPLTVKQFKSMRAMAAVAPKLKELQAKYKDDKQRQQQEIMKFYAENKINPFASCLPLLAQFPFFIGLFYLLDGHLRREICGDAVGKVTDAAGKLLPCGQVPNPTGDEKFLFIPDLTAGATGWVLAVLMILYVGSQLLSTLLTPTSPDRNQQMLMYGLPLVFAIFILLYELPGRPARVLDHDEPLDRRPGLPHPQEARPDHADGAGGSRPRASAGGSGFMARLQGATAPKEPAAAVAPAEVRPGRPAAAARRARRRSARGAGADGRGSRQGRRGAARARGRGARPRRDGRDHRRRRDVHRDRARRGPRAVHRPPRADDRRRAAPGAARLRRACRSTAAGSSSTPRATASGARGSCAARPTVPRRTRCARAARSALDAMTASERRLVHEYLREHGGVQTYSEGDEPDRHLVVAPLTS